MAKIDLKVIEQKRNEKLISTHRHPQFDLLIHDYTKVCQAKRRWDEYTLMCRGLITDLKGNIVSWPFKKFFNVGENGITFDKLPFDEFEATKKMDGSLGISYQVDGTSYISTRGSFVSEQAVAANEILWKKYRSYAFDPNLTYLWEIIYPENKIVVDYKGLRDIVLLEVTRTSDGRSVGRDEVAKIGGEIRCPVVESLDVKRDQLTGYGKTNLADSEGMVIKFKRNDERYKIKFEEYLRLHRLVTGVNTKTIWEALSSGKSLEDLLYNAPDEFYTWVRSAAQDFQEKYDEIDSKAREIFGQVGAKSDRRTYASEFLRQKGYSQILFRMLDGEPYDNMIWKKLKPELVKPFKVETDSA